MTVRVVITRPASEAQVWADAVQVAGYEPVMFPLLVIERLNDVSGIHKAWHQMAENAAVMFVSGNAVNFFMQGMPKATADHAPEPLRTRAWATGPGTRQALLAHGWPAHLIDMPAPGAAQFDSEALWSVVRQQLVPGHKVLVVRGETRAISLPAEPLQQPATGSLVAAPLEQAPSAGRDWLAQRIVAAGATPVFCVSYWRCRPALSAENIRFIQGAAGAGAVWLFSSSEALNNLAALFPGENWARAFAVATHERIAERALRAGFGTVRVARPTLADVLASIESLS